MESSGALADARAQQQQQQQTAQEAPQAPQLPDAALDAILSDPSLNTRSRVSAGCLARSWRAAAARSSRLVCAKVDKARVPALEAWLSRSGSAVKELRVHSCEPSDLYEEEEAQQYRMCSDGVGSVPLRLPCAALPQLSTLRLYCVGLSLDGLASQLTRLSAEDSYVPIERLSQSLPGLRVLSLRSGSSPSFGKLAHFAGHMPAGLARLRLHWTGDKDAELEKAYSIMYDDCPVYADELDEFGEVDGAKQALSEDVTPLLARLPRLEELELGCYTFMRGDEAFSRHIIVRPLPAVVSGDGGAARQALRALTVDNVLSLHGVAHLLEPSIKSLTRLELSLQHMRDQPLHESRALLRVLPAAAALRHLHIGPGMLVDGLEAAHLASIGRLSALTHLELWSNGGSRGTLGSAGLFACGPDGLAQLATLRARVGLGYHQVSGSGDVSGVLDLDALAAAAPGLRSLDVGSLVKQSAKPPGAATRALRTLTALSELVAPFEPAAWCEATTADVAAAPALTRLVLRASFFTRKPEEAAAHWAVLRGLTGLTGLQELDADPALHLRSSEPWVDPRSGEARPQLSPAQALALITGDEELRRLVPEAHKAHELRLIEERCTSRKEREELSGDDAW